VNPNDRLALLRRVCAETSQAEVARRIGCSSAIPCGVLKGTYTGDTEGFLAKVEEIYGSGTVDCPGLGEQITLSQCAAYRKRPFAAINPEWVRMNKACRACSHNNHKPVKREE